MFSKNKFPADSTINESNVKRQKTNGFFNKVAQSDNSYSELDEEVLSLPPEFIAMCQQEEATTDVNDTESFGELLSLPPAFISLFQSSHAAPLNTDVIPSGQSFFQNDVTNITPTIEPITSMSSNEKDKGLRIPDAFQLFKVVYSLYEATNSVALTIEEYKRVSAHGNQYYLDGHLLKFRYYNELVHTHTGDLIDSTRDVDLIEKYAVRASSYRCRIRSFEEKNYYHWILLANEEYQKHLRALAFETDNIARSGQRIFYVPDALKLIDTDGSEMTFSNYEKVVLLKGKYSYYGKQVCYLTCADDLVSSISGQKISEPLGKTFTSNCRTFRKNAYGSDKPKSFIDLIKNVNRIYWATVEKAQRSMTSTQHDHIPRLR